MAKKKLKGNIGRARNALQVYNAITSRYWKKVKSEGLDKKYSYRDVQKIVSADLYPKFKGKKAYKLRYTAINQAIDTNMQAREKKQPKRPKKRQTDTIRYYSDKRLEAFDFYMLDNALSDARNLYDLPVDFLVNAGDLGFTDIISTENYDYVGSGVRDIVEKIREQFDNASGVGFTLKLMVKDGREDNGEPDNYFVEFYMPIDGTGMPTPPVEGIESDLVIDPTTGKTVNVSKLSTKQQKQLQDNIDAQQKKARSAQRIREAAAELDETPDGVDFSTQKGTGKDARATMRAAEDRAKARKFEAFNKTREGLRQDLEEGLISKSQYKKAIQKLIDRFEKGGAL